MALKAGGQAINEISDYQRRLMGRCVRRFGAPGFFQWLALHWRVGIIPYRKSRISRKFQRERRSMHKLYASRREP